MFGAGPRERSTYRGQQGACPTAVVRRDRLARAPVDRPGQWAAQPFTPFIETLRGLLMGTAIGKSALLSVVWCVLIAFVAFRWGLKLYNRDLSHA